MKQIAFLCAFLVTGAASAGEVGEQQIVKDVTAAKGWTAVVPMAPNGDGLTDLLSYNATTGRAIYSVATKLD
jgi:hypothetical protein